MSWGPIIYRSPDDQYIEVMIFEHGVQLAIWKGDKDRSDRYALIPLDDWEKLASVIKAMRPQ